MVSLSVIKLLLKLEETSVNSILNKGPRYISDELMC